MHALCMFLCGVWHEMRPEVNACFVDVSVWCLTWAEARS